VGWQLSVTDPVGRIDAYNQSTLRCEYSPTWFQFGFER
jgi:hypothetical protein